MLLILTKEEITYYCSGMRSKDEAIQKNSVQELFQQLYNGRSLNSCFIHQIELPLSKLLFSRNPKVRKWAYHLALYIPTNHIRKLCISRLRTETDYENINWILAILSKYYSKEDLFFLIKTSERSNPALSLLSGKRINASIALFSQNPLKTFEYQELFSFKNPSPEELAWLTKFYGYKNLAESRQIFIPKSSMLDLLSDSNSHLQEYGMWSLYTHGDIWTSELPYSLPDYYKYSEDTLKWFFLIIGNRSDTPIDQDFLLELLQQATVFNRSTQEGLAKCLSSQPFQKSYVAPVLHWFLNCAHPSVQELLLIYMLINCLEDSDGTFQELLIQELVYSSKHRQFLREYLNSHPNSSISLIENDSRSLKYIFSKIKKLFIAPPPTIKILSKGDTKTMSKYEFNGNNNQIQINESPEYAIQNNATTYSKEELEKVLEQLSNLSLPKEILIEIENLKKEIANIPKKSYCPPIAKLNHLIGVLSDYLSIGEKLFKLPDLIEFLKNLIP